MPDSSHVYRKSSRSQPTESRIYDAQCILCPNKAKYLKNTRTREPLVKCTTLAADTKLRNAASRKMDEKVLALLSRDIVAAEAHYHRTCYRLYIKNESENVTIDNDHGRNDTDTDREYSTIENTAYNELLSYIRNELFTNPTVIPMSDITSKLVAGMNALGCHVVKPATKKHLRRRLETTFADSLHFVNDDRGRLIVYPESLSRDMLVIELVRLRTELNQCKASDIDLRSLLATVALKIRTDINNQVEENEWPPQPSTLTERSVNIPETLAFLLQNIIVGLKKEESNTRVDRLVKSYDQDIIYAVNRWQGAPTKHVCYPLS